MEGRCDGLSIRFQAAKVVGDCNKRHGKSSKHDDSHTEPPEDAVSSMPEDSQADEAQSDMPGPRRSLAGYNDKHGKKHADKDFKHGGKHGNKDFKHGDKHDHSKQSLSTFEDAESEYLFMLNLLLNNTSS